MKVTQVLPVAAGQSFTIDRFLPQDAPGVASLFVAVYGLHYPMPQYYDTDWLTAANASGELVSVVARTPGGDIVSHVGAYRSAAANPKLYELGIGLTLVDYRARHASGEIMKFLIDILRGTDLVGAYGEAVCNHTGMQKIVNLVGALPTGIEIDLMPAAAYAAEKSAEGRVSCMLGFVPLRDAAQTVHVPARYLDQAREILGTIPTARTIVAAGSRAGAGPSRIESRVFDFAAVSRCQVSACGADLEAQLERMERQAEAGHCTTRQAFLNLADPAIGAAADWLRAHGYWFAGFAPRWFDGDALVLQKTMHAPGFAQVKLLDQHGRRLLELVEQDWRAVNPDR